MGKINEMIYKGMNVTDKAQNKIDALVYFISRNEEISDVQSLERVLETDIYKKIVNVDTLYWTIPSSAIINEYLSERRNRII